MLVKKRSCNYKIKLFDLKFFEEGAYKPESASYLPVEVSRNDTNCFTLPTTEPKIVPGIFTISNDKPSMPTKNHL